MYQGMRIPQTIPSSQEVYKDPVDALNTLSSPTSPSSPVAAHRPPKLT